MKIANTICDFSMMRFMACTLVGLLTCFAAFGQRTYVTPADSQNVDDDDNPVVVVCADDYTLVIFTCYSLLYNPWISLSSKTTLNYQKTHIPISSWAVTNGDDDVEILDLDRRISIKRDRLYTFVLVFSDAIPDYVTTISITENIGSDNSFYWKGIHLTEEYLAGNDQTYNDGWASYGDTDDDFYETGYGTCFALSSDGYLATCYHCIEDADRIRVRGVNGDFEKTYYVKVVVSDQNNDLAILKISDNSFTSISTIPYSITGSGSEVGDEAYVLGYPLRASMGDEVKLTNGLISSRSGYQGDPSLYQISAAVQPGNSGGPVFNRKGDIIGVADAYLEDTQNVTYAVKTSYLIPLVDMVDGLRLPRTSSLGSLSLTDQVRKIKGFVYILETE